MVMVVVKAGVPKITDMKAMKSFFQENLTGDIIVICRKGYPLNRGGVYGVDPPQPLEKFAYFENILLLYFLDGWIW